MRLYLSPLLWVLCMLDRASSIGDTSSSRTLGNSACVQIKMLSPFSPRPARPALPTICLYREMVMKVFPMYGFRKMTWKPHNWKIYQNNYTQAGLAGNWTIPLGCLYYYFWLSNSCMWPINWLCLLYINYPFISIIGYRGFKSFERRKLDTWLFLPTLTYHLHYNWQPRMIQVMAITDLDFFHSSHPIMDTNMYVYWIKFIWIPQHSEQLF